MLYLSEYETKQLLPPAVYDFAHRYYVLDTINRLLLASDERREYHNLALGDQVAS